MKEGIILILIICLFPDQENLVIIVHALVTSRLDYCSVLYMGTPLRLA